MKKWISWEKIWVLCLLGIALFCFAGPLLSPYSLLQTQIESALQPPSLRHFLGTDAVGRDIFTRLMYGGRVSLIVGAGVAALELILGGSLGMLSGYVGGWFDRIVMGITDVFLCIPVLPSVLVAAAVLSDLGAQPFVRIAVMMLVIALMGWPVTARMVRAQVLAIRKEDYMLACEGLGLPLHRKMLHMVPFLFGQFSVSAALSAASAILTESALSMLGLGVVAPYPSWGNMLQGITDRTVLFSKIWIWLPSGIAIFLTVLIIHLLGDRLSRRQEQGVQNG